MNKWIGILKTKLFSMSFEILYLTQSSNILRKTQEHQEHSMAFGKDLIKTLRKGLARHEVN
jgi:hypothetical protein